MSNPRLAAFAAKMDGKYGKGGKISNGPPPVIVPTGSLSLDWALRGGGWVLGRVYEIIGPKDSGKSTLVIASMVSHLAMFPDRGVAYVNMENTFDPDRAMAMGLDCSDEAIRSGRWAPLLPVSSEDVSDMARDYCSSGLYSCIVVDSVGAMESARVLDKEAIKDTMGRNAQVITKMTKALSTQARLNHCTVLLVNQPRANFSGLAGAPDVSAGPKALQHSTTARILMSALGNRQEGDIRSLKLPGEEEASDVSIRTRARVTRLKTGIPGRVAEFYINRGATAEYGPPGIDAVDEYISVGIRLDLIVQGGGGQYVLPGGEKVKGRPALTARLRAEPGILKSIREAYAFEKPVDTLEDADAV